VGGGQGFGPVGEQRVCSVGAQGGFQCNEQALVLGIDMDLR
jgi:hypothetical protein